VPKLYFILPRAKDDEILNFEGTLLVEAAVRDNQRQNDENNGDNDESKDLCSARPSGLFHANSRVHQGNEQKGQKRHKGIHQILLFKNGFHEGAVI